MSTILTTARLAACLAAFVAPCVLQAQVLKAHIDLSSASELNDIAVDAAGSFFFTSSERDPIVNRVSYDGGRTWLPYLGNIRPGVVPDPVDPNVFYSADGVIRRTSDGGNTWHSILAGGYFGVAVDAGNRDVLIASSGNHHARTIDGGRTWKRSENYDGQRRFVSDRSGFGNFAMMAPNKLWISSDHGETWKEQDLTAYVTAMYFHPHQHLSAFAIAEGKLWQTKNLKTWARIDDHPTAPTSLYADPRFPGRVWLTAAEGIFRSEDNGSKWALARAGAYQWIEGCGFLLAPGLHTTEWSPDGTQWSALSFGSTHFLFGVGCRVFAYGGLNRFLSKLDASGKLLWKAPVRTFFSSRVAASPSGMTAVSEVVNSLTIGELDRFDPQGKWLGRNPRLQYRAGYRTGFQVEDGGSVGAAAISLGAQPEVVAKFGPMGDIEFTRDGTFLALDPMGNTVATIEGEVNVIDRRGNVVATLPVPVDTSKIHYLKNGDFIAIGLSRRTLWIARYAPGEIHAMWRTELATDRDFYMPETVVDSDGNGDLYLQLPHWVETRNPLTNRLNHAGTFLRVDRSGKVAWSTPMFGSKLAVTPQGMFVLDRARRVVERAEIPPVEPIGIDAVLGEAGGTGIARPGEKILIKGRGFEGQDPEQFGVTIEGVPAKILSVQGAQILVEVPAYKQQFGRFVATVSLTIPIGAVQSVEIGAN